MGNRACFKCGKQDREDYMYQVEVKNKSNDDYKFKWTCYPCQGKRHPIETQRLLQEERERRAEAATRKQEEKDLKEIAGAWKTLYEKELATAKKQLSEKLASPFENFDYSDVKADDKRAYDQFKEAVAQHGTEGVAMQFEGIGEREFDESKPLLAEAEEWEISVAEEYNKPGAGFAIFLFCVIPACLSYFMWEEFVWWQSLGAGAASWLLLAMIWSPLFQKKFPADFGFAIDRLKESTDVWSEGLNEMHETVLQNTIVELIKTNRTAEERLEDRFGSADELERMPYDKKESEREALKDKAKKLVRRDNFLDLISFVLLYKIADTDGEITVQEEERIASLLVLSDEDYAFANSFRSFADATKVMMKILGAASIDETLKEALLTNLYAVAAADGHISVSEKKQITEIGIHIGLTESTLETLEKEAAKVLDGSGNKMRVAAAVDELDFDDL